MIYSLLLPTEEIISFDVVTDFSESLSATVTAYQTEFGFPLSDNMTLSNPEFSLSGILSYYNSPSREITLVNGEFVVSDSSVAPTTQVELETKIRKLYAEKIPFTIIRSTEINDILNSEIDRIESCLVKSIGFTDSSGTVGAIFPKLDIVKINQITVHEQDITQASPKLIPINKVATQETVDSAKGSGDSPDGKKVGDATNSNQDSAMGKTSDFWKNKIDPLRDEVEKRMELTAKYEIANNVNHNSVGTQLQQVVVQNDTVEVRQAQ